MLTLTAQTESAMATQRIAGMLRQELEKCLPEVFEGPSPVTAPQLAQAVDEARDKLRPWGMETERIVLKYCFGSLLLGEPVEQVEPRLLRVFPHEQYHRYRKEEVLDIVVERELARRAREEGSS